MNGVDGTGVYAASAPDLDRRLAWRSVIRNYSCTEKPVL